MGQRVIQHPSQKLPSVLRDAKQGVQQLGTGTTTYVVDPTDNTCQAIVGNLATDNAGNATGLAGWGIAIFSAGVWLHAAGSARGGVTLAWSGGATSATETVTHNLGVVPRAVLLTSAQTVTTFVCPYSPGASWTDTTFDCAAVYGTALTGNITFSWEAVA